MAHITVIVLKPCVADAVVVAIDMHLYMIDSNHEVFCGLLCGLSN